MTMRRMRLKVFSKAVSLAVLVGSILVSSCSVEERVGAYLDYRQMEPPVKETPTFEVIGHRGYGATTPENTLAALQRSIDESVKIVEVDVRLTSDGVPVLLHDPSLKRTTGDHHRVSDLTLAEVKKLDAGSYKFAEFAGEPVPTLEEALLLARGKLKMLLHMKLPRSGPAIVAVIRKCSFPESDIWFMSDELKTLKEMRKLVPAAKVVHLVYRLPVGKTAQQEYVRQQMKTNAYRSALALDVPDEEYMALAHRSGLRVLFWTADHPYDSIEVDRFSADGVITNKPLMWEDWTAQIPRG